MRSRLPLPVGVIRSEVHGPQPAVAAGAVGQLLPPFSVLDQVAEGIIGGVAVSAVFDKRGAVVDVFDVVATGAEGWGRG